MTVYNNNIFTFEHVLLLFKLATRACAREHLDVLYRLFFNLLYIQKDDFIPAVSTVNLEPYHHVPARVLTR